MKRDETNRQHIPDYQARGSKPDPAGDWSPIGATLYAIVLAAVLSFIAWSILCTLRIL